MPIGLGAGLGIGGGRAATSSGAPSGGGDVFVNNLSSKFDGTNDYISIGATSSLNSADEASISWWGKKTGSYMQVGSADASNRGFWANWYSDNNIYFQAQDGNYSYAVASFTNDSAWHHFAVTYDGGSNEQKIYVDGTDLSASMGSGSVPNTLYSTTGSGFQIGTIYNSWETQGFMDEVALFNFTLTTANISALRGGVSAGTLGAPVDISSLNPVGWWRCGDSAGDTNSSGGTPANTGVIGTVVNAATGSNSGGSGINATGVNGTLFSTDVPA